MMRTATAFELAIGAFAAAVMSVTLIAGGYVAVGIGVAALAALLALSLTLLLLNKR